MGRPRGDAEGARALFNAFDNLRAEAEEYRELDNQRVLVLVLKTRTDQWN